MTKNQRTKLAKKLYQGIDRFLKEAMFSPGESVQDDSWDTLKRAKVFLFAVSQMTEPEFDEQ